MAITLDQLKQKTQQQKGFNAPGAAAKLQFLQGVFDRAAKAAAKDEKNESLANALEQHAEMLKRLIEINPLTASGEKEQKLKTALTHLTGFKKYLNAKAAWEPNTPLSYLSNEICKEQNQKDKLNEAIQSLDEVLELGFRQAAVDQHPQEVPVQQEAPAQEQPQEVEMANVQAQPVPQQPAEPEDPRTTPQLYAQALEEEIRGIDQNGQEDENDPEAVDPKEKLIGVIAKKLALKNREYGPFHPDKVDEAGKKIADFAFFNRLFADKVLPEMRQLASGDTKSVEKLLKKAALDTAAQPTHSWWPISVNAKDFTESVQKLLRSGKFANMDSDDQIAEYQKILAARTAVDAARGSFRGKALDKDMDQGVYAKTMDELDQGDSAVTKALKKMIEREGEGTVRDWACDGHGGLLEEKVKEEVRSMAREGDCKLGDMPARYRPTVGERLEDIRGILQDNGKWNAMNIRQKKFLVSEYALLQKDARKPGGMDAPLGDIKEHNYDAESFASSEKFEASVNDIEQVRHNLANPDLQMAVGSFRYGQTAQAQEEAKKKLAQKTSAMLKDALAKKNAKANGPEAPKPEGPKAAEGEGKKEEKKEENVAVPKV